MKQIRSQAGARDTIEVISEANARLLERNGRSGSLLCGGLITLSGAVRRDSGRRGRDNARLSS